MNESSPRRLMRWMMFVAGGVLLFLAFLYASFPVERINERIAAELAGRGMKLAPACRKLLLPGLGWESPVLSSENGPLIKAGLLELRPAWGRLLTGRLTAGARAKIGNGTLEAEYTFNGPEALRLSAQNVPLSEIPFFTTVLGAKAGGELRSEGLLQRSRQGLSGDVKIEVRGLEFAGIRLGALPLPDVSGIKAQGAIRFTNNAARLESLSFEGDGIYMRLSGNLPGGAAAATAPLDLTLEIMPRAEFMDRQKLVFLLLAKFMTSPGVYRIPIKGTLVKPEIL